MKHISQVSLQNSGMGTNVYSNETPSSNNVQKNLPQNPLFDLGLDTLLHEYTPEMCIYSGTYLGKLGPLEFS